MSCREFIGLVGGAAAWPFVARAQQAKIPRVGVIWIGSPEHESVVLGSLRKALADQGYVFGRDLVFDERYANGKEERIATLIAELLAVGVDVLVTPGTSATVAAHQATTTVPIVSVGPLVDTGLASSLARPGGNVTGIDNQASDYRVKWLELLGAVAPKLRLVAVLSEPDETPAVLRLKEAAPRFGLTLTFLSARPQDLEFELGSGRCGELRRPDRQRQPLPPAAGPSHHRACRRESDADPLRVQRRCSAGRPDGLFRQFFRDWEASRIVRRSNP